MMVLYREFAIVPKTLIICEKPNLMREVAGALAEMTGQTPRRVGNCIAVGDYTVAAFIGHVFGLSSPKVYEDKAWRDYGNIEALPVVVDDGKWRMEVNPNFKDLVAEIRKHALAADIIVNCGDAEREGQLLIDEGLVEFGLDPFAPNVFRLWSQTLSRTDLIAAIKGMFPNAQKQRLYEAAVTRSRADWQHGMTYSPLYTVLARRSGYNVVIPVGRVQTPTLNLVVERDEVRRNFKPVNHFRIKLDVEHQNGTFKANWVIPKDIEGLDSDGLLVDRAKAEAVVATVKGKTGTIASYQSDQKTTAQPVTFSLNDAQKKFARDSGLQLTAQETLTILQKLYDEKLTSYPRTDTGYLRRSLLPEVPGILAEIGKLPEYSYLAGNADQSIVSPAWNDSKTKDHYGLIPTNEFDARKVAGLSVTERKVLDHIIRQYLAQFYPVYRYTSVKAEVSVDGHLFKASGTTPIEAGWRTVFGKAEPEEGDDEETSIPKLARGDAVVARDAQLIADATKPPPAYNDDRLLEAMENCHVHETNPEIKKRLKDGQGIGRPATRAGIIENLITKKLLARSGKVGLVSTDIGKSVIEALPPELKSCGMTAIWEEALERIEKGEMTGQQFLAYQAQELRKRVEASLGKTITLRGVKTPAPLPGHGKPCIACGKGTMNTREFTKGGKTRRFLACTQYPNCKHVEWGDDPVAPMPGDGEACTACGTGVMKTKAYTKDGKTTRYLSCSNYPTCKNAVWDRPPVKALPGDGETCPECKKGKLVTRKARASNTTFLSCSTYPTCKYSRFPDDKKDKKKK